MGYSPLNNPYALTCTKCGLVCEEAVVSGESDCELLNGTRTLPRVTGTMPCNPTGTPRFGVVFGRVVEITCPDETDGALGEILYCIEENGEATWAHEVCCSCGEGSQISDLNAEITGYVCGVATFLSNLSGDISACCGGEEPIETDCCVEPIDSTLTASVELFGYDSGAGTYTSIETLTITLNYGTLPARFSAPVTDGWFGSSGATSYCGEIVEIGLWCDGTTWTLTFNQKLNPSDLFFVATGGNTPPTVVSCDPLLIRTVSFPTPQDMISYSCGGPYSYAAVTVEIT